MKWAGLILAGYAAVAADSTLTGPLGVAGVRPDLVLLAALAWLVVYGKRYGFLAAGWVALVGDLLGPGRVGVGAAVMLGVAAGVSEIHRRWALEHLAGRTLALAVGAMAWSGAMGLLGWCCGEGTGSLVAAVALGLGTGAYTAALGVPVLMVLGWMHDPPPSPVSGAT